jgi:hypothetical protein
MSHAPVILPHVRRAWLGLSNPAVLQPKMRSINRRYRGTTRPKPPTGARRVPAKVP